MGEALISRRGSTGGGVDVSKLRNVANTGFSLTSAAEDKAVWTNMGVTMTSKDHAILYFYIIIGSSTRVNIVAYYDGTNITIVGGTGYSGISLHLYNNTIQIRFVTTGFMTSTINGYTLDIIGHE